MPKVSVEDRFWEKVDKSGDCWLWTASTKDGQYGCFWMNGRSTFAHRTAWEIHNGPIPDGILVCHTCDTPLCVRPAHLWLGTNADNMRDRDQKGRQAQGDRSGSRLYPEKFRGENNGRAILTEPQVIDIRERYVKGRGRMAPGNVSALADEFGTSTAVIWKAATGRLWAHLPNVVGRTR